MQYTTKHNMKKGFTLIELMVSIFIFLLIMLAIIQIFAQQILAYRRAHDRQHDLENAQYAMNYFGKTLRTSTVLGNLKSGASSWDRTLDDGGNDFYVEVIDNTEESLIIYDFSQEVCLRLTFRGETMHNGRMYPPALWMQTNNTKTHFVGFDQIEECLNSTVYSGGKNQPITTGQVWGGFLAAPTRYDSNVLTHAKITDAIGRVTIMMKILPEGEDPNAGNATYMQTTVSLRDYPADLSF
ncbi:MAG: hypothetical protein CR954_00945 [Candidatus Moraniibacteriota bacterium]|nr:MAG: hypothetical protein CR954_00945 [Candidatus Moranbacteria bacterium]